MVVVVDGGFKLDTGGGAERRVRVERGVLGSGLDEG